MRFISIILSGLAGMVAGYLVGRSRAASRNVPSSPENRQNSPVRPDGDVLYFAAEAKKDPRVSRAIAETLLPPVLELRHLDPARFDEEVDRMVHLSQAGLFTIDDASAVDWQLALLMKQRLDPLGIGDFSDIGVES